jgi:tetratricopeptide (TPR) repeat protein
MRERLLVGALMLAAFGGLLTAQWRDRLGNPPIQVPLTHPPELGIEAKRVAFGPAGGPCSDQLIDALISVFVKRNVEVIDRQHLNAILAEHNFSLSGYVDQKTAAELGKILGPAVLIFVKVQRCDTQKNSLTERRKTYDRNTPVVTVHISRTQAFVKGSIQAVDLATGRIFAAKTFEASPKQEYTAETCCPEFPSEHEVLDMALGHVVISIQHMFFPWTELRQVVFFDDKDCDLKIAHQLLKAGDLKAALHQSEQNLARCKNQPKIESKTLAHAYYNVGMTSCLLKDYDKGLEYLREAAKLRPGDVVSEAISVCNEAKEKAREMQALQERIAVEAAQTAAKEEAKQRELAAKTLTISDVVAMRQAGLSEELIATRIRKEGRAFDLTPQQMVELKKAGLSDDLIKIMMDPTAEFTRSAAPAPTPTPPAPAEKKQLRPK